MSIKLQKLQKYFYMLVLILSTQLVYGLDSTHKEKNFEKLLNYFQELPTKVTNQNLQHISKSGTNVATIFHDNNYQQYAKRIVPIGKIRVANNYVLVVGQVDKDVSSDKSMMYVGAFLFTDEGKLIDTEKYLTQTGELAFQKQQFKGSITKKGKTYHFYNEKIDITTGKSKSSTTLYKMTKNKISYEKTLY